MRIRPWEYFAAQSCFFFVITALFMGYLNGQCALQTAQVTKAKADVARTQQAINSLGFSTDSEQLTEWGNLSADETAKLKSSAYKAIVSDLTAGFDKVLKSAGQVSNINGLSVNLKNGYLSIGTAQAQGIAARLQQAGLNDIQGQAIQGLVRSLGKTTSKAAKTEIAEKIIKGAEAEKDAWEAGKEIADNPQTLEQKAELAATVLDLFGVTAPSAVFENGQGGAQILISLGTSAVSYNRINQLSNLTSMKLAALKTLTNNLVKQTDALRASNTSQQNCLQLAGIPKQQLNLNPKAVLGKSGYDQQIAAYDAQIQAAIAEETALVHAAQAASVAMTACTSGCHDPHWSDCITTCAAPLTKANAATQAAMNKTSALMNAKNSFIQEHLDAQKK